MISCLHALAVYNGSDAEATRTLYAQLSALGPQGEIAVNLFRAHKTSTRAKLYRGRQHRDAAYDTKQWSIANLCRLLAEHSDGMRWGWKEDTGQPLYCWVFYIDLPAGQVSFHTDVRGGGPDYGREWDGLRDVGAMRICRFIEALAGRSGADAPISREAAHV